MTIGLVQEQHAAGSDRAAQGEKRRWELLMDPQGLEEEMGDMLLRVAGTRVGVTALQLNSSVAGGHCHLVASRAPAIRSPDSMLHTASAMQTMCLLWLLVSVACSQFGCVLCGAGCFRECETSKKCEKARAPAVFLFALVRLLLWAVMALQYRETISESCVSV